MNTGEMRGIGQNVNAGEVRGIGQNVNAGEMRGARQNMNTGEILRVEQLYVRGQGFYALENFSMHADGGDFVFLCDPENYGAGALAEIFSGRRDVFSGRVWLEGRPLTMRREFSYELAGIYVISMYESMQPYMTVEENLFLSWKKNLFLSWPGGAKLREQTRRILAHLGIDIPMSAFVKDLSYEDRQLLKLARAYCKGAKLVFVDGVIDVVSEKKQRKLLSIMDIMRREGALVMCASQRFSTVMEAATKLILFKDGKKIWTMRAPEISRTDVMNIYRNKLRGSGRVPAAPGNEPLLEIYRDGQMVFNAPKGRCIGIYAEKRERLDVMADYLTGEYFADGLNMRLGGQPFAPKNYRDSVAQGMWLVDLPYFHNNFSENLSVEENMYLPDMGKMHRFGLFCNRRYENFLAYEYEKQWGPHKKGSGSMNELTAWHILFTRLILGSAKIVLCLGTFPWNCWVTQYDAIQKFVSSGKTFIFLSVNLNELSAVSHECYNCENILP